MTTPAPAAKPKRNYFNRPKWTKGATENKAVKAEPAPKKEVFDDHDDFFSRSNETFASIALEEEERERHRRERRAAAAAKKAKSPTPAEEHKPSVKRRRLSAENEVNDDGAEHFSDIEAERAEEAANAVAAAKQAEKKEFTDLLDKGKAYVQDGMVQLGMDQEQACPPSPSKLPPDVPRIPNDEECDRIRQKNSKLAPYDNDTIRQLALRKWEQKQGRQVKLVSAGSPRRRLRSSVQAASEPVETGKAAMIELDEDEPPHTATSATSASFVTAPAPPTPQAAITIADNPEDDEMAELERRAREKNRRKRLLEEPVLSPPPGSSGASAPPGTAPTRAADNRAPSVRLPGPTVQLLVTSEIPGTRPLIIKRELDQRFKEVREYWCHTNGLPQDITDKVSLRWKSRVLYDSQNCLRLGFVADSDGNAVFKDSDGDIEDYGGKIHLVAEAEGIPGLQPRDAPGEDASGQTPTEREQPTQSQKPPAERDIRITIQARGYADCKIVVNPSTPISRLIGAFKKTGKVPDTKSIALMFEGELLQPNSTVGQTEMDDMDKIDAYVR